MGAGSKNRSELKSLRNYTERRARLKFYKKVFIHLSSHQRSEKPMGNNQSGRKKYKIPPNAERPGAPGPPSITYEEYGVSLRWDLPKSNGGCPIIGYTIQHLVLEHSTSTWLNSNPVLNNECYLENLIPGLMYQFRVVAENLLGYSDPSDVSDIFHYNPGFGDEDVPSFKKGLQNYVALEHERVELSVEIRGYPTPTVEWSKDNFTLTPDGRINLLSSGPKKTLIIREARVSDSGEIKCIASNEFGYAETLANLTVEAPPHVKGNKKYDEGLLFQAGQVVRLKFNFTGSPKPSVFWYHDGNPIEPSFYEVSENSSQLKITNACRGDRGEYMISVENELGHDTGTVLITITDKPGVTSQPQVVILPDNSCVLKWSSGDDGGSQICSFIVEYYRDGWGVWLKAQTTKEEVAKIKDLIPGSKYRFRVKAENLYGVSEASQETVEIFIPDPKAGGLMDTLKETEEEDEGKSEEMKPTEKTEEEKKPPHFSPHFQQQSVRVEEQSLRINRMEESRDPSPIRRIQIKEGTPSEIRLKGDVYSQISGGGREKSKRELITPPSSLSSLSPPPATPPIIVEKGSNEDIRVFPTPQINYPPLEKHQTLPGRRMGKAAEGCRSRSPSNPRFKSTPNIYDHYDLMSMPTKSLTTSELELRKGPEDKTGRKSYFILEDEDEDDDSGLVVTCSSLTLNRDGKLQITRSDTSLDSGKGKDKETRKTDEDEDFDYNHHYEARRSGVGEGRKLIEEPRKSRETPTATQQPKLNERNSDPKETNEEVGEQSWIFRTVVNTSVLILISPLFYVNIWLTLLFAVIFFFIKTYFF